jgi:hypothetical protein
MESIQSPLLRVLRPLVRLLVARGVRYPDLCDWLKATYLAVVERDFRLEGKRVTDSRVHLLTGLQRRDVKALRARPPASEPPVGAGPLPRVIALWLAAEADSSGPRRLGRAGPAPSFEALVARVSRDIHARTVLDELVRLGLVRHDRETDEVELVATAFVPSGDSAALGGYFGANLGDHAEAAVANLLVAPEPGPFFERAVHYDHLAPGSLDELDALARRLQGEVLSALSARALALQDRDSANPAATGRFRCGAYVYSERGTPPRGEEP